MCIFYTNHLNKRPVRVYRPLLIAWVDSFSTRLAIVSACVCVLNGGLSFNQSIDFCHSNPSICLLIEMIKLGAIQCCISTKQAACKRVFVFTGRLCEVLVLACFEVAAFGCVSVSSIANVRDGALLG